MACEFDAVLSEEDTDKNGMYLAQAWQDVGRSAFVRVVDAVRNRTMQLALEIQPLVGQTDKELGRLTPESAAAVERNVTNYIYGGNNVFATGNSKYGATSTSESMQ